MTAKEYLQLKNGSDVRGIACEGVAGENVTLTAEAVENVAKAFCVWLISHTGKTVITVAIGHDSRITANFFPLFQQKFFRASAESGNIA